MTLEVSMRKTIAILSALVLTAAAGAAGAAQHYNPRGDIDHDGISNRYDRDRDGDRIANASDPHPNRFDRRVVRVSRYGPRGDLDRDGIQNRYDRDRDGDGIRNARDRRPDHYDRIAKRGGPRGDRDRDGVANRYDRDRDGDGVRNIADANPNNPRRH
jgi:hypothetical protein